MYSIKQSLVLLMPLLAYPTSAFSKQKQSLTNKKPNVLFIMVDDFGWKDVGYNGSKFYETPNIDRLSREGMCFTNGYAAAPVSSPTRVSTLTGQYTPRTQVTEWIPGFQYGLDAKQLSKYKMITPESALNMPLEKVTIAEELKKNGYKTYHIGKWHCADDSLYYPQYQGFEKNIGGWLKGSPNGDRRAKGGRGSYFSPYHNPYLPDGPDGEYLTDRLGTEGVQIIQDAKNHEEPFFMYLSFYAVHTPIEAKPEVTEYFKEKAKKMGIDTIPAFTQDVDWYKAADYKSPTWKERTIQSNPEYAALIYSMDENVGRVLDALKAEGLEDNTIVCLLSDNGGLSTSSTSPTCNAPLRAGKGWLYEGGIREPFIIKYPQRVKAGSVCNTPVVSVDFYPTILDMANLQLKPQQHIDGVSLRKLLEGKKQNRGPIYFHYPHYGGQGGTPAGAVRDGDYKLIEFFEDNHVELYNLANDISEKYDLSAQMPELTEKMKTMLHKWRKDINAKLPTVNTNYKKLSQ